MFFLIICFCILGYAIYLYNKGEKDKSTFIFFLFLSDGFGFFHSDWLSGMAINKYRDFALLYLTYVAINHLLIKKGKNNFKFPIYKWFAILVFYLTLEFIFTVSTGREFFGMSLAVYRYYLIFFSFILFQDLTKRELRKVIINVSIFTLFATIVYVTQPIHRLPILDDLPIEVGWVNEGVRYRNVPSLLYFILIYITIRFDFSKWKSVMIISLCGISLVLTQHRGVMLGYVITVAVFLLLTKEIKKAFQYGLIGLVGFMTVGSIVVARFENKGHTNTFDDISNVLNMDYARAAANEYDDVNGGTLSFRILLFIERFDYFKSHPQYMLTGIGMRHEDSPNTQREFHFMLGAWKRDKQTGNHVRQQIDCTDLVWFTPFVKFGIIGLFFYLNITYLVVVYLFKNRRKGTIAMVAFFYYVLLIIISMKNAMLFGPVQISFLFMLIELIRRTNIQSTGDIFKYQEFKLLGRNMI